MTHTKGFAHLLLLVIAGLLIVGSGTYVYTQRNNGSQSAESESRINATTTASDSVVGGKQNTVPQTSSATSPTVDLAAEQGWLTYTSSAYGYTIQYPTSWGIGDNWSDGIISSTDLGQKEVKNLVTRRDGNLEVDETTVMVTIAVHPLAATTSLPQWMASHLPKLPTTPDGDLGEALSQANAGRTGLFTKRYTSTALQEKYEVGAVVMPAYFTYITYLRPTHSPYVYSIEIDLPIREAADPQDPDSRYTDVYRRVVSSFMSTN